MKPRARSANAIASASVGGSAGSSSMARPYASKASSVLPIAQALRPSIAWSRPERIGSLVAAIAARTWSTERWLSRPR